MRLAVVGVAFVVAGCSAVFDPSSHQGGDGGGVADAGGGDAGPTDGGPVDGGPVDSGAADAGLEPVRAALFCPELVARFCVARDRCCSSSAGESVEACETRLIGDCNETVGTLVTDTRNGYDPVRAALLLADLRVAGATCATEALDLLRVDGLRRALTGTIPVGESCGGETAYACNEPARCIRQSFLSWQCQLEPAGEGDACFLDYECGEGLRCDRLGIGTERCESLLADDARCQRSEECESRRCGGSNDRMPECLPVTVDRVYCPNPFEETIGDF